MNLAAKIPRSRLTLDDFFAIPDDPAGARYELVDGELRSMSPASSTHAMIQSTAFQIVSNRLAESGGPCRAIAEGAVTPRLGSHANLRVPDILVTCKKVEKGQMTFDDPILIVEVLSPTNEKDTRDNIRAYATIPSVREIVLINSVRIEVELFRKNGVCEWPPEPEIFREGSELSLRSIDAQKTVAAFYEGTHLVP